MGSSLPQCQLDPGGLPQTSLRTSCLAADGLCPVNLTNPGCCLHHRARSFSQPEADLFFNKLFRQNSTLHDFNSWDKTVVYTLTHTHAHTHTHTHTHTPVWSRMHYLWPSLVGVGGRVGGGFQFGIWRETLI